MHVAIDLRIADAPGMEMTGAGRYALETARSLQQARPSWRFSLFSNRPDLARGATAETSVIGTRLPTERAGVRVAWLHTAAALPTLRLKPDIWFSPSFVLPIWWQGTTVVTIHDLTFLLLRGRYRGRLNAWYASAATRWSARHADRVLCGSHATRNLLSTHLGIDSETVAVIPYGVAETFFAEQGSSADTPPHLTSEPYVLFVGTWEARKGLSTLYEAIRLVNAQRKRVRLVLAGQDGWGTKPLMDQMRRDPAVELCEKPSDEELAKLYRGALALAYPSEMEGFGLPVAEAMACNCPVIASDLPPIREFAGEYPLYIEAGDSGNLATHIEQLLNGDSDVARVHASGREAVASLRWSVLGDLTANVIEQVTGERRTRSSART